MFERPIITARAGSITPVAGRPRRFRVLDATGADLTHTHAVELGAAFRILAALARASSGRDTKP